MSPLYWITWSSICAAGTGLLVFFVMQSTMEVLLSKQREELAAARALSVQNLAEISSSFPLQEQCGDEHANLEKRLGKLFLDRGDAASLQHPGKPRRPARFLDQNGSSDRSLGINVRGKVPDRPC